MTASPGSGNASSVEMATDHISELCANMDAMHISVVRKEQNVAELMKYARKAAEGLAALSCDLNLPAILYLAA